MTRRALAGSGIGAILVVIALFVGGGVAAADNRDSSSTDTDSVRITEQEHDSQIQGDGSDSCIQREHIAAC